MGDGSCFLLFPKELWEMILDRVEDSKDVLHVFKAFPELDISFENKKQLWLVGQAFRILMNRFLLEETDILKCRLVCKQWKMRVDCALETQSVLRAYHMEQDKEEKDYWEAYDLWYLRYDSVLPDFRIPVYFRPKFLAGVVFNIDFTNVAEFLEDMEFCPPKQSPFVGRTLTLIISNDENRRPPGRPQNEDIVFWSKCFQIFERYGNHVWHLKLYIDKLPNLGKGFEVNPPLGIWNTVLQVLARLPNLKSWKLDTYERLEMDKLIRSNITLQPEPPCLPNLESLSIPKYNLPDELINPILTTFGSQLRQLELAVGYWREGMNDIFKNLTELEVHFDEHGEPEMPTHYTPEVFIPSLTAPRLVKLRIRGCDKNGIESDVFKWLRWFPSMKYLNIGDLSTDWELKEENGNNNAEVPIEKFSSLEYLWICDTGKLSFNFLRSFPSLRVLKLYVHPHPYVTDLSIPNSQIKLREQLQTLKVYDSNIWEHLPKLMSVVVYDTELFEEEYILRETYKFSREGYEKTIRGRQDRIESNCIEFNDLRMRIQLQLARGDDSDSETSNYSLNSNFDEDFEMD